MDCYIKEKHAFLCQCQTWIEQYYINQCDIVLVQGISTAAVDSSSRQQQ